MKFFDDIQQSAKKKAFQLCLKKYDCDGQKGLNKQQLAGFLTEMCSLLGVPLKCAPWQAKLAMLAIDQNSNGVADVDQLYKVFIKAQGIMAGEQGNNKDNHKTSGSSWHDDGKIGNVNNSGTTGGSLGYGN